MALLAGKAYDPATAGSLTVAAAAAMTAIDTTNLRLTFTAPGSGNVLVRMKGVMHGAGTSSMVLFGVLDGATVKGRCVPMQGSRSNPTSASHRVPLGAEFIVTGLTGGTSYTWDAAVGTEVGVASGAIKFGGPDNATTNDAFGAFSFEIYSANDLLAGKLYDPATLVQKSTASLLAMTALDTTNLRLTFTAPSSGSVLVRLRGQTRGSTTPPDVLLGVLDGATVKLRVCPQGGNYQQGVQATTDMQPLDAVGYVNGLTAGTSYTWDAAYGVEIVQTSSNLNYGGPNNATASDADGGFGFEIWNVDTAAVPDIIKARTAY